MKSTNMSCLTPEAALSGDCGFLSANMYARSIFGKDIMTNTSSSLLRCKLNNYLFIIGEDALANISIEKQTDGAITGHVRIRSKTQGIALSLGDKITLGI
jgi:coatomer subunit beta